MIEKLSKNELPVNEYPCMNDPSPTFHGASHSVSARVLDTPCAHSMRSRRSSWSRVRLSDDGYTRYECLSCVWVTIQRDVSFLIFVYSDSVLRRTASEYKKMGKRIFVFIVGGATRSEVIILAYML